jgi:hypothetical protein
MNDRIKIPKDIKKIKLLYPNIYNVEGEGVFFEFLFVIFFFFGLLLKLKF